MKLVIDTFNLMTVERTVIEAALRQAGSIIEASALLGIDRHALKRRIVKHGIRYLGGGHIAGGEAQ